MTLRAGRALTVALTDGDAGGTAAHSVGAHPNGQPPALIGVDLKQDAGGTGGRVAAAGLAARFDSARTLPPAGNSRRTAFLAFRTAPASLGRRRSRAPAYRPTRLDTHPP